ncbi:DUF3299 domain-containing protein [Roseibium sp. SCP14]|uniref:DUF3299 domain-containing protein n=1 Tax=Roseibium sp. SCP14 TaxID=3141375 RepID=UPI00333726EA
MRMLLASILLICMILPVRAVTPVDWEDLKDPAATTFDDPFAALSMIELRSLATVLRLRKRLGESGVADEARSRIVLRLADEEARLAASGVDTDALLAQREAIARKRAQAALAGNPALSGKEIAITGYVIPVLEEDGIARTGYLVPEYGMCSHVPAPDPNQMIRYRLKNEWQADRIYQKVRLTGRLGLRVSRQTINLLDGQVEMISAFELETQEVQSLEENGPDVEARSFRSFVPPRSGAARSVTAN